MLGRNVFVFEVIGRLECGVEYFTQRRRDQRLRGCAAYPRELGDLGSGFGFNRRRIQAELVQDWNDDATFLPEECNEQVLGRDLRVSSPSGEVLRLDDGFLSLDRKLVEIHVLILH